MIDNFEAYIDSLGELTDEELFEDIDETMARKYGREGEPAPFIAGKVGE
jgi:hypothetical protein